MNHDIAALGSLIWACSLFIMVVILYVWTSLDKDADRRHKELMDKLEKIKERIKE